jgi:hypothetical protein
MFIEDPGQSETNQGTIEQISLISDLLNGSKEHALDPEIIFYALKSMKENPELEPYEAFAIGHSEWMK